MENNLPDMHGEGSPEMSSRNERHPWILASPFHSGKRSGPPGCVLDDRERRSVAIGVPSCS
jgi:hypothetical protein